MNVASKLAVIMAAALALPACSSLGGEYGISSYEPVSVRYRSVGNGSLAVAPPRPWNRQRASLTFEDVREVEDWTLNGPYLDGISFVTGLKGVFAFEFYDQDMVGVKGYDAEILDALERHKVWIIAKTTRPNSIQMRMQNSDVVIQAINLTSGRSHPRRFSASARSFGASTPVVTPIASPPDVLCSTDRRFLTSHDPPGFFKLGGKDAHLYT